MNSDDFKRRASQVLQRASLAQRCEGVKSIIEESSTKELHGFFPDLLGNIFGFDSNSDWGLKTSLQRSGPYTQLRTFLSPSGPIFTLINKLQADGCLKYEFFVKCLPLPTQNLLSEGNIPLLYHNKIQMSNVPSAGSSRVVLLNAFEYYMFHFAYYIIYQQNIKLNQDASWLSESQFVYLSILEDYLNHFLPTAPQLNGNGVATEPGQSNIPQNNVWFSSLNRLPPNQTKFAGLIRTSPFGSIPVQGGHCTHDQNSGDIWRSEMFLQILIEFWLNQNTMDSVTRNVLSHGQVYFMPSIDLVRVVRMVIKQVHTFVFSSGIEALNHPAVTPLDELKRTIIPQMLQKKLYCFLRHGFAHWPLDPSFRVIVETWLSFIQPWRYANLTQKKSETTQLYSPEWCDFVFDNFPFFSVLVQEFVLRALKFDFYSSKDAFILLRVTKILSQEGLKDTIEGGEKRLSDSPKNSLRGSQSTTGVPSVRATYFDLEGHAYDYYLEDKLERLAFNVSSAIKNIHHPGGVYGQDKKSSGGTSSGWLKSLFSGEFLDNDYNDNRDTDKATSYLEQSYKNLSTITKICSDFADSGQPTPTRDSRLSPSFASSSTISHGSIPECILTERGYILTEKGKYQIINGIRRFEVYPNGDPELQPIRSYENPTLVRFFYHLSTYLNSKFGDKLNYIYTSPGMLSTIAYKLSPSLRQTTRDPWRASLPSPPVNQSLELSPSRNLPTPRISLRFLASYKTMVYLMILYLLCRVFSLGSLAVVVLFILVFIFSIVGHICPVHRIDGKSVNDDVQKKLF